MSDTTKISRKYNRSVKPGEMKAWRVAGHRALRRRVHILIGCEAWQLMPLLREIANVYNSPGDGRGPYTGERIQA